MALKAVAEQVSPLSNKDILQIKRGSSDENLAMNETTERRKKAIKLFDEF